MPLSDGVQVFETVGGVLLGTSGLAFLLLGIFLGSRQKSAVAEVVETRGERKLDLVAKSDKRPLPKKAPVRKAA